MKIKRDKMSEIIVENDTLITSKTDLKGNIIYANKDFCKYAEYDMEEILYKPHNIIRHEDMPRCVFKLLWDYIRGGKEVFAFIKNKTKKGNFYWVFANVTPTFDARGATIDYYSVRRAPRREVLAMMEEIYSRLLAVEKSGLKAGSEALHATIAAYGIEYNEFIYRLQTDKDYLASIKQAGDRGSVKNASQAKTPASQNASLCAKEEASTPSSKAKAQVAKQKEG